MISRRAKMNGEGWTDLKPIDGKIRSLDSGLLEHRIELKGLLEGEYEFYRTMIVNQTFIFPSGATRYIGFVTKDYEEYTYQFNLEEWVVQS